MRASQVIQQTRSREVHKSSHAAADTQGWMGILDLNDDGQRRVPAGCLGEMPRAGLTLSACTRVLDLERTFLGNPGLSSVVIVDSERVPACLSRVAFFSALSGDLGFGRSLYARHAVSRLPLAPSLMMAAATRVVDAAHQVLRRRADARYEDFVVDFGDGEYGTMAVADLFAELAHTHAFDALHDGLTGLANRRLLVRRLREVAADDGTPAVLFIDVDDFKTINDGLGHDVGDETLTVVAERLRAIAGRGATVARLGGDEFAIVLPDCSEQQAGEVAAQAVSALSVPLRTGEVRAMLSGSVGIALAGGGTAPDELLRNADLAMYAAKRRGKGTYAFYEDGMHEAARLRLELRSELEGAIARDELYLDYQPIVAVGDAGIVGAEALLRWRRRDGTVMSPVDFIGLCEQTGMIIPIGRWVLTQACGQAMAWAAAQPDCRPLGVSVNVSPWQLHRPGLIDDVATALSRSGLPPSALTLEITEGVLISDPEIVLEHLAECRALGVKIALDDFGAGFSSLGRLSQMPIDALKLDRSFLTQLGTRQGRGLVTGIVALADSLDLVTVGEGVETEHQAEALQAIGCQLGQGYHYARPMPPEHIAGGAALAGGLAG
jgi:diguanylate cyclase (GGDEF)-like protein